MTEAKSDKETKKKKLLKIFLAFVSAVGFVSGVITIYSVLLIEKKVNLTFELVSRTNVLDVKENVSNLDIIYDGKSLQEKETVLQIIVLKVVNYGNQEILPIYYDEKDPIGFEIINGKILERPTLISFSNNYIKRNTSPSLVNENKVLLNKLILEPGEYYSLKLLIMTDRKADLQLSTFGKIAGQKEIQLSNYENKAKETFLNRVLDGQFYLHVTRLFFYIIIILSAVLLTALAIVIFVSFKQKISSVKREKIVKAYKRKFTEKMGKTKTPLMWRQISSAENEILDYYYNNKEPYFHLTNLLAKIESIGNEKEIYSIYKTKEMLAAKQREQDLEIEKVKEKYSGLSELIVENNKKIYPIEEAIEHKIVIKEGNEFKIEKNTIEFLKELKSFLVREDKNFWKHIISSNK